MVTDSFFLEFKNMDVFNELSKSPLKEHMDLSNFPQDHNLFSNEHKGKLGYLKSETAAIPMKEIIALSPKCYSILLDDKTVKSAAKGVPMTEKTREAGAPPSSYARISHGRTESRTQRFSVPFHNTLREPKGSGGRIKSMT